MMLCLEDMSEKVVNYITIFYAKLLAYCNWMAACDCDLEPLGQVLVKQFKSTFEIRLL